MKKLLIMILATALLLSLLLSLSACADKKFYVHFFVDGALYDEIQTVHQGESIIAPTPPEKKDFIFGGWYYDPGTWEKPLFEDGSFDVLRGKNISLHARWLDEYESDGMMRYYVKADNTYLVIIEPESEKVNEITVPSERNGMPITEVGYVVGFDKSNVGNISSVTLPDSLTRIGDGAFSQFSSLTRISIPKGVTEIGKRAFEGCSELKLVELPFGIKSVGELAFSGCRRLESILCASRYYEHSWSDSWCEGVESAVRFYSSNGELTANPDFNYMVVDGVAYITKYKSDSKSVKIPAIIDDTYFVASLGTAFVGSDIEELAFEDGFAEINEGAFGDCASLRSVSIPESVVKTGFGAFSGCTALETLTTSFIGAGKGEKENSHLGYIFGAESYEKNASYVPESLTELSLIGAESIGKGALWGCEKIETVALPRTLTEIGAGAFYNCLGLKTVKIESIDAWCKTSFANDTANPVCYARGLTLGGELLETLEIPRSVKSISAYAFFNCESIRNLSFHSGISDIGEFAFCGCSNIGELELPEALTVLNNSVFFNCSSLSKIKIPGRIKTVGESAFRNCTSLSEVLLGEGIESIDSGAFRDCTSLGSAALPSTLTRISSYLFANCTSLVSVEIPASVTTVCREAFVGCKSLGSITLPSSVSEIELYAFRDCTALLSAKLPSGLTSIGRGAFYRCTSLGEIALPDSLRELADETFFGCLSLRKVTLGQKIYSIGKRAFLGCESLESCDFTENVVSVGDEAFSGCISLSSFVLTGGVRWVGANAFRDCHNLYSVTLVSSFTRISGEAFSGCTKLVEVIGDCGLSAGQNHSDYGNIAYYAIVTPTSESVLIERDGFVFVPLSNVYSTKYHLVGYRGEPTESLTLPKSCDGNEYFIYEKAFYGMDTLKSVTVSDGVLKVGKYAFSSCDNLETVIFEEGTVTVEYAAFYDCGSLCHVTLPESVSFIEAFAFSETAIEEMVIPGGVKWLGMKAFQGCRRLSSVEFASPDGWYSTASSDSWEYRENGTACDLSSASDNASKLTGTLVGLYLYSE